MLSVTELNCFMIKTYEHKISGLYCYITLPWTGVCQNSHVVTPSAEVRANSVLKKPLKMLI